MRLSKDTLRRSGVRPARTIILAWSRCPRKGDNSRSLQNRSCEISPSSRSFRVDCIRHGSCTPSSAPTRVHRDIPSCFPRCNQERHPGESRRLDRALATRIFGDSLCIRPRQASIHQGDFHVESRSTETPLVPAPRRTNLGRPNRGLAIPAESPAWAHSVRLAGSAGLSSWSSSSDAPTCE
jgi:hypothetical protein